MNDRQKRPNVKHILDGLKDFQQQTVDYVFKRLYEDEDSVDKFLVADEVGLGKTLVARGVLARAVDSLWEKEDWIDIIYVCSNQAIASQNAKKLNITGKQDIFIAKRMTYLPLHMKKMRSKESKLNFAAFTPGTSFGMKHRTGRIRERALIYHILRDPWHLRGKAGPKKMLRSGAGMDSLEREIRDIKPKDISRELSEAYLKNLEREPNIHTEFDRLSDYFSRRKHISGDAKEARKELVSSLRRILAATCVEALRPRIVILDEFQRFRHLLESESEDANLARALFDYPGAKVILLSATPYKMYTVHGEGAGEEHYRDFMRTAKFLMGTDGMHQLRNELARYRSEIFRVTDPEKAKPRLFQIRDSIEKRLSRVMVRTERLSVAPDRNGMLSEAESNSLELYAKDLVSFSAADRVSQAVGASSPVEYWKSVPFMLNTMDDSYQIKRLFEECINDDEIAGEILSAFDGRECCLLDWGTVQLYGLLKLENARLRKLIADTVETGAWQLLWLSPSLPYYRAEGGPYAKHELSSFTKALVFSSWKVAPKAIAMLCSYEAERRMVTAFDTEASYREERKKRGPLLRFARKGKRNAGMSTLLLMYPCMTLAREIDPLKLSLRLSRQEGVPSEKTIVTAARTQVKKLIEPILASHPMKENKRDNRWYWAALALLDRQYYQDSVRSWLDSEDADLSWWNVMKRKGVRDEDSTFTEHLDEFYDCFCDDIELGRPPKDLVSVLARIALASPAVVSLRALSRQSDSNDEDATHNDLLAGSAKAAAAFRVLFNIPESITMVRSLRAAKEERYWDSVLGYCLDGNLQSVMDEYVHILKDSLGLIDVTPEVLVRDIAKEIRNALAIRTAVLGVDVIETDADKGQIDIFKEKMRCRFALSFGDSKNEDDGGELRAERVRSAFNSPFRPFILATTSIGQEGLDFHQYCHSVVHWNLPSNPVDLEQREGRVHRYKGHAIRRNVAMKYPLITLRGKVQDGGDPWEQLFKMAVKDRSDEDNDLVPFWVFDIEGGEKIRRIVPALPLSREIEQLEALRRSLVLYRMVFGQVRQEDLLEYLQARFDADTDIEEIMKYRIDLSPPT